MDHFGNDLLLQVENASTIWIGIDGNLRYLEHICRGADGDGHRRQRGSVTVWGLGLTLALALFAGLVIDTWRVFAERQDLSGMADSASIAGATAVDIPHLNETGEVILDAGLEIGLHFATLDLGEVDRARARVASLQHDRPFGLKRYQSHDKID